MFCFVFGEPHFSLRREEILILEIKEFLYICICSVDEHACIADVNLFLTHPAVSSKLSPPTLPPCQSVTLSHVASTAQRPGFKNEKYQDVPCGSVRGGLAEAGQFLVSIGAAVEQGQILFTLLLTGRGG